MNGNICREEAGNFFDGYIPTYVYKFNNKTQNLIKNRMKLFCFCVLKL